MSRYYGCLQGSRGKATRQGTANSGISGHIRGWHIGANVTCYSASEDGEDVVHISITGGSSNSGSLIDLGLYKIVNGKATKIES